MQSNAFNTGKPFERILETILTQYAGKGLLRLKKVDPPTRTLGKGRIIHLPNPFLDFVGAWTARNGRAVFMEAKSTSKPQLGLDTDSGITPNQIEALRHWHNAGAVAFVLWETGGEVRMLNWPMVQAILPARKHAKLDDGLVVPSGMGFIIYDFLAVMSTVWPEKV